MRVLPLAGSEEGHHAVMHGGQVAEKIDDAIFSGRDRAKEFLVGQIAEEGTGLAKGLFPTEEDRFCEKVLGGGGGHT
jgi:hypothetical protein